PVTAYPSSCTLPLHDALPIYARRYGDEHRHQPEHRVGNRAHANAEHVVRPHSEAKEPDEDPRIHHHRVAEERLPRVGWDHLGDRSEEHTSELQSRENLVCRLL